MHETWKVNMPLSFWEAAFKDSAVWREKRCYIAHKTWRSFTWQQTPESHHHHHRSVPPSSSVRPLHHLPCVTPSLTSTPSQSSPQSAYRSCAVVTRIPRVSPRCLSRRLWPARSTTPEATPLSRLTSPPRRGSSGRPSHPELPPVSLPLNYVCDD